MRIDIEKLLKQEKKATPGPWTYDMGNWEVEKEDGRNPVCVTNNLGDDDHPRIGYSHHDGEFIAAMRNVILPLIKELKAARKIVADYREIYDDHDDLCNLRDSRDMYDESHFKCSCGYEEAQKLLKELDGEVDE